MDNRLRFAPSPTGYVHIGNLRTALYNYLFAKKTGGKYIVRIEDTDRTRLVGDAVERLLKAMDWVGVTNDEGPILHGDHIDQSGSYGPYVQSERLEIYNKYIDELLEKGHAYYCFCTKERLDNIREEQRKNNETPRYDGLCRDIDIEEARKRIANGESHVVRLKLPENLDITFEDITKGTITINTDEMDDQVLIKQDGFPTYHFAVVVDDHLMKVTHVIRGEEWLSSTPKHVYMFDAFGWDKPKYVHLPTVLNSEKKKLSKRSGDAYVEDFRNKGYLPEALINYLALVGWSPDDNQEIMSLDELVERFSLDRVSKSSAVFDVNKLNWFNSHYIKECDEKRLIELAIPFIVESGVITYDEVEGKMDWITKIVSSVRERIDYLGQIKEMMHLFVGVEVKPESDEVVEILKQEHVSELLSVLKAKVQEAEVIDEEFGKTIFKTIQKETGVKGKNLFMPIRCAISGQVHGMDMGMLMVILGKDLILERINYTVENLL